jgi:uncharacterized protein YndB with AHSA1/START domain
VSAAATETLELERRIRCRPETLFAYFTDPDKHALWQGREVELDPRPGGIYRVNVNRRAWIRGEYVLVEPPHRLVIAWGYESEIRTPPGLDRTPPGSTTLEITLTPDGDEATIVRLRHSRVPPGDASSTTRWAWEKLYLDRLAAAAEGRNPGYDPLSALIRLHALLPIRALVPPILRATARAIRIRQGRAKRTHTTS